MGRFRYYMCPEGMIEPAEVPAGWGLVYVAAKRTTRVVTGATLTIRDPGLFDCQHDAFSETLLLANLLHRVGNPEKLNGRLRAADRLNAHLQRTVEAKEKRLRLIEGEYYALKSRPTGQSILNEDVI